jgi:hypothetical protein
LAYTWTPTTSDRSWRHAWQTNKQRIKADTMPEIIKVHPILTGWLCFVILVYIYAYLDYLYYQYNIKDKASQLYEALTEEE